MSRPLPAAQVPGWIAQWTGAGGAVVVPIQRPVRQAT
jgi:hypothetical protein